jgi:ATP-binding cassette subfamily C (CFTR/MRP) protein 4
VRGNVLFGRPFNAEAYRSAVERSCLLPDFALLEKGDATVVGERGTTLSGGQKARVALARALYSDSDILLLDDPISAVDSRVARQIHEGCLRRLSADKTVILVTHQIAFLYDCDRVIIMEDGAVKKQGTPKELEKELREISALS